MVNRYETVFIVTPVLSEEQMKETVRNHLHQQLGYAKTRLSYSEKEHRILLSH